MNNSSLIGLGYTQTLKPGMCWSCVKFVLCLKKKNCAGLLLYVIAYKMPVEYIIKKMSV